ncbi:MAG: serine/threonine-protein kinase [Myxococcales bacterium]|nr:serine/threonine protein kinase [Polyangiaceae bacterium]MDW8247806.1 serine/threonine-protein kinase [Myxococcales bacterium]
MTKPTEDDELELRRAADPLIGMVIADRYRILSVLGAGGMGVVYKVAHIHIGKLMAMKLLAGSLARDPVIIKRFKREALAASRLSHPNTVQVFDYGQANNLTYLVMELVPGDDLSRVLKVDGPFSPVRLAKLMVQICGSLSEAHAAGIIHRDLKPENVLLVRSRDGKEELPKVCDFGVAKLHGVPEGANDATHQNTVVGTPYYMAPEQIRGEEVDPRADIYALGAMMYRLLTGVPPFEAPSPMTVFAKHLTEEPKPPSECAPHLNLPRAIDAIVLKAMAKRREDRYPTAAALQQELIEFLRSGNTSSVEMLVEQGQIQALATRFAAAISESHLGNAALPRKAATRDEVAAYERKLALQRLMGQLFLGLALLGGVGLLWLGYTRARAYIDSLTRPPPPPEGTEREPNDEAARANEIPFGKEIRGQIGKRFSPEQGDRDFFAYNVPAGVSLASLRLTALPNFAICLWLYRSGFRDPLARLCSGAPKRDLVLPAYRIEPGRYLLAVLQDMEARYPDVLPVVHENVSDYYTLTFAQAAPEEATEVEPNDSTHTATRISLGTELRGVLNFTNDTDVICPAAGLTGGKVRWIIRESISLVRPTGTALEATLDKGGVGGGLRFVIHRAGSPGKPDATNVLSPHTTPALKLDGSPSTGCLTLRLIRDPWVDRVKELLPSDEPYAIRLESAP